MDNKLFYVVDPSQIEFSFEGMPLQKRRDCLGELVRERGAEWECLRICGNDFLAAVEELDRFVGADEDLVNSAFENSPKQMLPIGSSNEYDPLLGYFEPERVQAYNEQLCAIPASALQAWEDDESNGEIMSRVVYVFRSTFAEAAKRKHSIAVEHR